VVARRLGMHPGVEVFRESGVTVRMEELIDIPDDGSMGVLAERLLVAQLPRNWRHVPDCRLRYRDSVTFRGITTEGAIEAIETLRELKEWREEFFPRKVK